MRLREKLLNNLKQRNFVSFRNLLKMILKKEIPLMLLEKVNKYIPEEPYLKVKWKLCFDYPLDLNNPKTFNEKLNWLKLNYHNPMMTVMADKYWAKKWIAEKIGDEFVVPCYGHWYRVEDIDFDSLPVRCFLKSNQDSGGGMLIDKSKGIDIIAIKNRFSSKKIKKKNWFWSSREWGYKHIEPCILAEEFLDEGTGHELHDYKFWCFDGKPTYMYITNKGAIIKENFYDMDFKPVDINHGFERTVPEYSKPDNFEKMKEIAAILSEGMSFVRIDFFNVNGKLYFGECTFYDWAAFKPFVSVECDKKLGDLIKLPINY